MERTQDVLRGIGGKRLTYRGLVKRLLNVPKKQGGYRRRRLTKCWGANSSSN